MRRGETYYMRVRVPLDLLDRLGLVEVRKSLGTSRLSEARLLGPEIAMRVKRSFETMRAEDLTSAECLAAIKKCFAGLIEQAGPDIGFNENWEYGHAIYADQLVELN